MRAWNNSETASHVRAAEMKLKQNWFVSVEEPIMEILYGAKVNAESEPI